MRGVRHRGRKGVGADENEKVSPAVDVGKVANRLHQVPQADVVVAASVHSHVDHQLVRMLVLDQVEESLRMLVQIFVPAKTAVHSVGFGEVNIPEIFIGLLPEQGSFFVRVCPVQLLRSRDRVNIDRKFFPVVIGQGIAYEIAVTNNARYVQKNSYGQKPICACIAQDAGLIGGREGKEHFMRVGHRCVFDLDNSCAEGSLISVRRCNDAIVISEAISMSKFE